MKIHQIYTHNQLRNFTYIIQTDDQQALVIDPWDAEVIEQHLSQLDLNLSAIINTHEHWDHTQGNQALVDRHQCDVWAHQNGEGKIPGLTRCLVAGEEIDLANDFKLLVLDTPGHTFAHLCFMILNNDEPYAVFTGDTLFNAGVGNCGGGGDPEALYQTISEQFVTLPDDIKVYPGHDYLENNLGFTLKYEPSNSTAKDWLSKINTSDYQPGDIVTTIGDEKQFNTFMRLSNAEIIESLDLTNPTEKDVFIKLRSLRNSW